MTEVLQDLAKMNYFKASYLLALLPLAIIIYSIAPKKFKSVVLLIFSMMFFYFKSTKLVLFIIISIISVYFYGKIINKYNDREEKELNSKDANKKEIKSKYKSKRKLLLVITILFNLAFLIYFKYLNFFSSNLNLLLNALNVDFKFKAIKVVAPLGISYYTLSAISYIVDVYNKKLKGETNFIRMALFLSFFPHLMEGPILSYDSEEKYDSKVTYNNILLGYQRIVWGLFKKKLIADRLNILVKIVFNQYTTLSGLSIFVGAISYLVMLYAEFSGTIDIVLGSAKIFNINLPENFKQPFFSKNISQFWTRWHISLGNWFKNYIFYPVSLSKPLKKITLKLRKVFGSHYGPIVSGGIALFIVWFLNGLWHGAGYNYLAFGMFHFIMILLGNLFEPLIVKICEKLKINRSNKFYRVFQSVKMTLLVVIGEIFFRAETVSKAFYMIGTIFTKFSLNFRELLTLGLDIREYIILFISIIALFVVGILKEKNIDVNNELLKKKTYIRWIIYFIFMFAILIFGAYGYGYSEVDPIYAEF